MTTWRRVTAALVAATTGTTIAVAAAAPASAAWVPDGYYLVPHSGEVWKVVQAEGLVYPMFYEEWAAEGFPAPQPAPTEYVKYPWAPTISAVTIWDPEQPGQWYWDDPDGLWSWEQLDLTTWRRAGSPAPRDAAWIEGSYVYRWATSDQVLVEEPGGVNHVLSYGEWRDTGFHPYVERGNEGFIRYSWDPTVVRMTDLAAGQGQALTFDEWRDEAFPAPQVVTRVPGDQLYRHEGSATVWYAGPGLHRPITYAEWSAMGRPTPVVRPAR